MELPLEYQDVADNNIYFNQGNTSDEIFHCYICGKSFELNYLLKNHLAEHRRQVNYKTNKCKFCDRQFKLKFGLNRHIQKHHNSMYRCKFCRLFIDCSMYNEHKKYHEERDQNKFDTISNIKLNKINGVWKSKKNKFKCNICFQKCYSENNLVEHMETHEHCLTQCNDCFDYVLISELNNHMENIHSKHLFKCQKCNQKFQKQLHLNCHLIHCSRSFYTKSNKVCGKIMANEKICPACGIVFNNSLSLKNHTTIGCKHYSCKYCGQIFRKRKFWLEHTVVHENVEQCAMLNVSTDTTSTVSEYNQTEILHDSSFNTNGRQFLSRDVTGKNISDHTRLVNSHSKIVSTASQNSIENNCLILNIKQEKTSCTNARERNSSVNSNEQKKPCDLMMEQNPIKKASNNIVSKVRETPYFCIRKLPNIKNEFCNDDYDQTSQSNVIFICRICKNSPSTDIHSFALHMSDHRECNMHECIVCDKKFTSVVIWTEHMIYHQQQIDLNVSTVQFNPIKTESNTFDPIKSRNMEPQIFTNLGNTKYKTSLLDDSHSDITRLNSATKIKSKYDCSTCKKVFPSKSSLKVHETLHNKSLLYSCRYCDKIFSRMGPRTNHEKAHINLYNSLLQNNENIKLEPIAIQNRISKEFNNTDSETMLRKQKKKNYIHGPVNGNSSGTNSTDIKHLWFPCDVCETRFSTPFQLNVHRKSHSGIVPYICKICNRSYQLKFQWNRHLKGHYKNHNANSKSKQRTNNLKSNFTKSKIESTNHKDKMNCQYCKKEYNSISQWKTHISMRKECRRHNRSNLPEFTSNKAKSGRFRCNICMKTYKTSYNRTKHIKNIHNVLETRYLNTYDNTGLQKDKLMDIIQQKLVIKKQNKSNHINSNQCELCGKIYTHRANLSRHISINHTQKYEPMTCNVCGNKFKHKFSYRAHLKNIHKHYEETNFA